MSADQRPSATPPQRIQRKREKGWTMPKDAVYVGRPTRWGNPFEVIRVRRSCWMVQSGAGRIIESFPTREGAAVLAVEMFRDRALDCLDLAPLRGKDLTCWCPPGDPCHADLLLALANPSHEGSKEKGCPDV